MILFMVYAGSIQLCLPKKWNWGQHTQLKWSTNTKSIIAKEVEWRST